MYCDCADGVANRADAAAPSRAGYTRPMSATTPAVRFGVYRLDLAARELARDGALVPMSPKVFDCLAWLVEHRERAVGRDELAAAVWGRADVTETQLDQLIRNLRRAVGDSGNDQEVIRTVPRFGYRWVAELTADAPAAEPIQASTATPRRSRAPFVVAAALAACAAAAVALLPDRREAGAPLAAPAPRNGAERIAVLPVVVDDALDSEWAWLRLGLMDLIATRLRESGVTVTPANNILALTGDDAAATPSVAQTIAATGARIVVAPSVRRTSAGWRLRLELHGAEDAARELEAHADDAVGSARDAADRLLVQLGRAPAPPERTGAPDEDVLVRRVDAAIAGNDFDAARRLVDGAAPALRERMPLQLRRAELDALAGRYAAARERFAAILEVHANAPLDPRTLVQTLHGFSVALVEDGHPEAGKRRLDEAIDLAGRLHEPLVYAAAMRSRAIVNAMEGRDADADRDFAKAGIALELAGDTLGSAQLDASLAGSLITRHRYADAGTLHDRAIARLERFAPGDFLVAAYGNKIYMQVAMLRPLDALATARHAREVFARTRNARGDRGFDLHEARALIAAGQHARAGRLLDAIAADPDLKDKPGLVSNALIHQAQLAFAQDRIDAAASLAAQALAVRPVATSVAAHTARGRAIAWRIRTRALQRQGAVAAAADELKRYTAWAAEQSDAAVACQVALAQAEQAASERRGADAIAAFESALASANRAAPADIAQALAAYGTYLIDSGQPGEATRIVGQAARFAEDDYGSALLQVRLYHALGQPEAWRRALANALALAGERAVPAALATMPPDIAPGASVAAPLQRTSPLR